MRFFFKINGVDFLQLNEFIVFHIAQCLEFVNKCWITQLNNGAVHQCKQRLLQICCSWIMKSQRMAYRPITQSDLISRSICHSCSLTIWCVFKLYSVGENFAGSNLRLKRWVQMIQIYIFLLFLIFILIALINLFYYMLYLPYACNFTNFHLRYLIFLRCPLSYSHTNRLSLLSTDKPQGSLRSQLSM